MSGVTEIDLNDVDVQSCEKRLADCVIVTHDNKILLQYRPPEWGSNPDGLNLFGGHVDEGESIIEGLLREIKEEVGADVKENEVQFIGAVSEDWTNHKEFVHLYFWHDKENMITGCYEAEARYYESFEEAVSQPNLMKYAVWALRRCRELGLL